MVDIEFQIVPHNTFELILCGRFDTYIQYVKVWNGTWSGYNRGRPDTFKSGGKCWYRVRESLFEKISGENEIGAFSFVWPFKPNGVIRFQLCDLNVKIGWCYETAWIRGKLGGIDVNARLTPPAIGAEIGNDGELRFIIDRKVKRSLTSWKQQPDTGQYQEEWI